jgi:lipopolysaccharide export LptBFGC system permease protein LptF
MKLLQIGSVLAAITILTIFPLGNSLVATAAERSPEKPAYLGSSVIINHASQNDSTALLAEESENHRAQQDLSYLAFYPYAELPPERKPADVVLDSLSDVPVGTPLEEIKRASDAFALDFGFMRTIAKIESDFKPKQRTGSYIGLFQSTLSWLSSSWTATLASAPFGAFESRLMSLMVYGFT